MGMSSHIVGIKPPNSKWKKMKKVWDSCEEAGIDAPKDVREFFNYEGPDEKGVLIDIEESPAVTEYLTDGANGYEVDLTKLPPDVNILRFYNSY